MFDYIFQEGRHLNILNLSIIQIKCEIIIHQKYHIIKNILEEYWKVHDILQNLILGTPFPTNVKFEKTLLPVTPLIKDDPKTIWGTHGVTLNHFSSFLMHAAVQTRYDTQYMKIRLRRYINTP